VSQFSLKPRRQHCAGDTFQRFALLGARLLVDVIIGKVPVAVRFHHRLAFWTLAHFRHSETVEPGFAVITFLDEEHLAAAAGHLGRFGIEPAWTRSVA